MSLYTCESRPPVVKLPRDDSGFTLIEAITVGALLAILVGAVAQIMISASRAQRVAEMYGRATSTTHALLDEVRHDLVSSVGLFHEDAIAARYLALIVHDEDLPIGGSTLPSAVEDGIFEMEASRGARTGNSVLCARHDYTEQFRAASGRVYSVDVFKLVYWFLTRKPGAARDDSDLTLRRWVSEPLADAEQIDLITDADDQSDVLLQLLGMPLSFGDGTEPVQLVWRRGEDPTVPGTLRYIIAGSGQLSLLPREDPSSGEWHLRADSLKSSETFLRAHDAGVATNRADRSLGVARFGRRDDTGDGFPHGFEVQMIGPRTARQVLIHLTMLVARSDTAAVSSDQSILTFVSEL